MGKLDVYITKESWESKPTPDETKKYIAKPILKNKVSLSLDEFATEIAVKSKVCMLGVYPDGTGSTATSELLKQDVLMIDVDNNNEDHPQYRYEDALEHPFVKKYVSFVYKTLGNSVVRNKFRLVIVLDEPITSSERVSNEYVYLYNQLRKSFNYQIDESTKNANRLFYGGREGYTFVNKYSKYKPKNIDSLGVESTRDSYIQELYTNKEYDKLKKLYTSRGLNYNQTFSSLNEFAYTISRDTDRSMAEILDLPDTHFHDLFHDESTPSANTFRSDEGVELYKCFSHSNEFTGTITQVISKLLGVGIVEANRILAYVLGADISEPEQVTQILESVDKVKKALTSPDLKSNYPFIKTMLWRYIDDFCVLLDVFSSQGFVYNDKVSEYQVLSYFSRATINKKIKEIYGKEKASQTLHTTINLMAILFLIEKLPYHEIPNDIKKTVVGYKKKNTYKRYTDVIKVPFFPDDFMESLNDFCKVLKDTGFTKDVLTKDYVMANYGKDRALNAFSQTNREQDDISEAYLDMAKDSLKILERTFKKKGYITEQEIVHKLYLSYKRKGLVKGKADVTRRFKKVRGYISENYGYERQLLTQETRKELNVSLEDVPKNKRPHIFVKM